MKAMKRITAVQGRRGSTLIEILVTIFVLTGGLFVLYGMYPQGFNILENARNINTAKGLIQTNISDLRSRAGNLPFAIVPCDDAGDPDGRIQQVEPHKGKTHQQDRRSPQDLFFLSVVFGYFVRIACTAGVRAFQDDPAGPYADGSMGT